MMKNQNETLGGGHAGRVTLPTAKPDANSVPMVTLPERKQIDHRGLLSLDITQAWYFITICAVDHKPWVGSRVPRDRGVAGLVGSRVPRDRGVAGLVGSRVPRDRVLDRQSNYAPMTFAEIGDAILSAARWYHQHAKWHLGLFLVMPDHLHFIAKFPSLPGGGHAGRVTLPAEQRGHAGCVTLPAEQRGHAGRVTLPMVEAIQQFKSYLMRMYGLSCQRDFFETRLRDDEHYVEKFTYVCRNPVRKGLCVSAKDWPHVIAFDRVTGEERPHR